MAAEKGDGNVGCLISFVRFTKSIMEQTVTRHGEDDPSRRINAGQGAGKKTEERSDVDQSTQKAQAGLGR